MTRSRSLHGVRGFALAAAAAVVALTSLACNRIHVEDVRGPDGGDWVRISCRHMDKKCYRAAANMCPNGYYFADSKGPAPVRAREVDADDEASSPGTPSTPKPQVGVNTKTLPPQDRWSPRMYSKRSGAILVQCATATATASN